MSGQIRAWKVLKSFELALIVGGLAGLIATGLFYCHLVGDLGPQASFLLGVKVGTGLTLIFTYVFDRVSKLAGRLGHYRREEAQSGLSKERHREKGTSLPTQ